ncbi:arabinose ABC transporter substrate-binding protein [Halomonas sp. ISL-60]|uniref:arabinose ABC transporter substrate-binding protein n=1 Tax=unclassified Halomonas TaxID=2609666 RepID=UPI0007DA02AA|nr:MULTISPECIES: arabinose ABC transporter substrate-binding protein [unclassified Halomonas]MBT2772400.1 arabinose ABC transporter substrate-binding protein [Halomonas sp. ISL-60]MBT2786052.1 arabinose ABC transporter substrate-binding protein [Halomonas sp. ISL-106]MBT2797074.1 arabinose ABC transporter substrate-binding protein [Halomonas sp. ISL-104]MBT2803419.1 arabinose ABC transporter substrate-binding protein [Halomonas sp. ISL-56]MDQ7732044.1 arabinose ABC transporter substrate-bindin
MKLTTTFARLALGSAIMLASLGSVQAQEDEVKIGFIVKKPEQAWFINEQKAATEVGEEFGFDVVRLGGEDGQEVLSAIDNLYAQGAQGFVICPPDVRLGPAIMNRANQYGMKVVTVDDQFVNTSGEPMEGVPHLGMSGTKIGRQVGEAITAEMEARGWNPEEVAALRITNNELPTAVERTDGATEALLAAGFPEANIFDAPQQNSDTASAFSAASPVLSQYGDYEHWIIYALNEESVLGGVRATEQYGMAAEDVIGVGINGSGAAFAEFSRDNPTGFHGTVAVSSTMHGRQTAEDLYRWISEDQEPPANTETSGTLMTRDNWQEVRAALGL